MPNWEPGGFEDACRRSEEDRLVRENERLRRELAEQAPRLSYASPPQGRWPRRYERTDWHFSRAVALFEDLDKQYHLSTGSEYPDSPCGSSQDLVYRIEKV